MSDGLRRWGVEVIGPDKEKAYWMRLLQPPFDPYLEKVADPRGNYHVLRTSQFDDLAEAADVDEQARRTVALLNAAMRNICKLGPISVGSVVDFSREGQPKKHAFLRAETTEFELRAFGFVSNRDADGNEIPTKSNVQLWMKAAQKEPRIASAIGYLSREATWYDFYKAYEALWPFSRVGISRNELKRFKQTANALDNRHSPHSPVGKKAPEKPMSEREARALLVRWLNNAINDVLK